MKAATCRARDLTVGYSKMILAVIREEALCIPGSEDLHKALMSRFLRYVALRL